MAELATAWVQIVPSARGMQGQLEKELAPAAKKAGDSSGKGFAASFEAASGKSLKDFGKSALIGAAAFGVGLVGVANAAGGLSAALSANEQVLGDSSKAVQDFAKTSVESVGLSERAVLQAATAFGQLGKVAGLAGDDLSGFSIDLVKMAADLAAFADVPASQAVDDLRAAFAGSVETMQKYNIFLNETELKAALFRATGEKVTGTLTAQQRVLATQAALLEQTGDIQGQAAREADGFQRAQDNLKATLENTAASIGESVLPAMTGFLTLAGEGIGAVGTLNDATGGLIGGLLLVGTTALGAGGSLALIADKTSKVVEGFKAMSQTMQYTSIAAASVTAVAVAGFLVYDNWRRKQEEIRVRTDEVAASLKEQVAEQWALAESAAGASGEIDGLAVAQRALNDALLTGDDGKKITESLGALGLSADKALFTLSRLRDGGGTALRQVAIEAGYTSDEAEVLARTLTETTGAGNDFANSVGIEWTSDLERGRDAIDELMNQAGRNDLDAMADSYLNTAAAGSGLDETQQELVSGLVDQARAAATSTDGTYDAVAAYNAYNKLLDELTPQQRELILGLTDTAAAADDTAAGMAAAAESAEGLNTVAASTVKVMTGAERAFEKAADQASAFNGALEQLVGTQIDLQASQDDLAAGIAEMANIAIEAAKGTEGFSTSLDANSEAGRANRELVRGQASEILNYSKGMLEAGKSVDEASAAALWNTGVLRGQLQQFGLTEEEADAYLSTLGLTPDSIETAVELYGVEDARSRVQGMLDKLGELEEPTAAYIQTLIDEGSFAAAEAKLENLIRIRTVPLRISTGGDVHRSAMGAYFDRPSVSTFAEEGPEAILPLTKPDRMRSLLADGRILGPILNALPRVGIPERDTGIPAGDLNFIHYGDQVTPGTVAAAFAMAGYER